MRADRLIAIMMLLQETGRITAKALAEELEVSERTIYRDIDALGIAGVPVYALRGPGGGIALLESFRTDLTGLTTAERQALLALSIPAPLFDLGIGADLRSALRKLTAAVPHPRSELDLRIQEKFFIDNSEWPRTGESESLFETVRRALWDGLELAVNYHSELGSHAGSITAVVRPYGLVAASGNWHLVAGHDQHTIVISLAKILSAETTAERFDPPQDFQLASFWQDWVTRRQLLQPSISILAYINETALPLIGDNLVCVQDTFPGEGKVRAILRFETLERARTWILGFGKSIEVIEPLSLRLSIVDYASQILSVYENEQVFDRFE